MKIVTSTMTNLHEILPECKLLIDNLMNQGSGEAVLRLLREWCQAFGKGICLTIFLNELRIQKFIGGAYRHRQIPSSPKLKISEDPTFAPQTFAVQTFAATAKIRHLRLDI
uniref:VHS domain-containing protein n=1 Tax=Globodera rostochiensis TaxID=31243 RepID=A0A914IBG2_GLORO